MNDKQQRQVNLLEAVGEFNFGAIAEYALLLNRIGVKRIRVHSVRLEVQDFQ